MILMGISLTPTMICWRLIGHLGIGFLVPTGRDSLARGLSIRIWHGREQEARRCLLTCRIPAGWRRIWRQLRWILFQSCGWTFRCQSHPLVSSWSSWRPRRYHATGSDYRQFQCAQWLTWTLPDTWKLYCLVSPSSESSSCRYPQKWGDISWAEGHFLQWSIS